MGGHFQAIEAQAKPHTGLQRGCSGDWVVCDKPTSLFVNNLATDWTVRLGHLTSIFFRAAIEEAMQDNASARGVQIPYNAYKLKWIC